MQLAKRMALIAALVGVGLGLAGSGGCKKEKKDEAPAASKSGSGSGTGSGTSTGSAGIAPAAEAAKAISGFAAVAKAEAPGKTAGGMGGAFGGLFGGGAEAKAATAPSPPGDVKADKPSPSVESDDEMADPVEPEGDDEAMTFDIEFPPASAKGGDCAAVTDRLMIIVQRMIEKEAGSLGGAAMPADQMAMIASELTKMCVEQKWSQELKDCALTASDPKSFQECEKYAPADTGPDPEPVAAPKDAPAWTGGNACTDVAARLRQLTLLQMGDLPAEAKGEVDKALDQQVAEITESCTSGQWSEAWRTCITRAPTMEGVSECFSE